MNTPKIDTTEVQRALGDLANTLDAAAGWGADVRLPGALEPILRRLSAYLPADPDVVVPPATTNLAPAEEPREPEARDTPLLPPTPDLIIDLLRSDPTPWTLSRLTSALESMGWSTTSPNPRGMIANSAMKVIKKHPDSVISVRRGVYQWRPQDARANGAVEGTTGEPSDPESGLAAPDTFGEAPKGSNGVPDAPDEEEEVAIAT